MISRAAIVVGLLVYVVVLGCVLIPGAPPSASVASGAEPQEEIGLAGVPIVPYTGKSRVDKSMLPLRGAGMQIQRVDWIDKYKKSIDEIAELGCDTVMFEVDARMENGSSSRIYLDMRMTPTPEQLGALIDHAKLRKLRVVIMPIVLLDNPQGDEWRGTIKPTSWDEWFEAYRDVLVHFAWIAEGHHADVFVLGSELVSTENKIDEWDSTIRKVRSVFKGMVTYSANWDHYTSVPFWRKLDMVGMNSYWDLATLDGKKVDRKNITVESIQKRWAEIQSDVIAFARKQGKPLLLVEAGWCSLGNAASEPWDYTQETEPIDNELQRKLYEAFFKSWYGNPNLGGFMLWEWTAGDGGKGSDEDRRGYTPENKPAEEVAREWLKKGPWKVN
ncbi:MAG TPA: hypothetical protein VFE58_10760 [Tepidisphaeraceae bacterium]|jgi:hypothetical protein|nr:hypothetical protein [Tepidisphaeraceae bacterium]